MAEDQRGLLASQSQHYGSISNDAQDSDEDDGPKALLLQDGWLAWSQVLAGHLALFDSWGYIQSYALFESYYTEELGLDLANVAWAGSVQIFLAFFLGTFAGRLTDTGHFSATITIGAVLQLLGVFATSFCKEFWQLFLAQGICGGIGSGLMFTPIISLVAAWFTRNKTLAMCTMAAGTGVGGIVFPVIAQALLSKVGFAWTVRVMGFVMLFNNIVILAIAKPRLPPRPKGPYVEWVAFSEAPYTLFAIGMFLTLWALYVAFSFVGDIIVVANGKADSQQITTYATDVVGLSKDTSLTILLILNSMGVPGRLIPGHLADLYGTLNVMIPCIAMTGILFYCWIAVESASGLIAFTVVFGLIDSAVQGLVLGGLASVNLDPSKMGTRAGMILTCVSFAALAGGPTFGALVDSGDGSFLYAQIWGGTTIIVGCGFIAAARIAMGGWDLKKRL